MELRWSGGTTAPLKNKIAGWVKAGTGRVLLQFGMNRDMDYPDAPTVLELLGDPAGRAFFELAFTEQEIGSPYVLGPKVPATQMEILEKAVIETLKRNKILDGYIRLVVTRGVGDLGLSPWLCKKATVFIITDKITLYQRRRYRS